MRAIQIKDGKGPVENLFLGEAPEPVLHEGYVMVKTKAFGLNGADTLQRHGLYPLPPGTTDILGLEFSGYVSALGEGVTGWKVGDEVFGLAIGGAYAEHVMVPQGQLFSKPSHLSWVEAASIPEVFLTAYQALVRISEVKEGDNVLIHAAASGVGIAAVQLARMKGAKTVIGTASKKEKLDWLLNIPNGITQGVNYKTQDFAEEVKKITNGHGVDVVIDFVGRTHWSKNIDSMAVDGHMTLLAMLSGSKVPEVDLHPIIFKRLRIQGSTLRTRSLEYKADLTEQFRHEFLDKITGAGGDGPIKTYIDKVFSWKEIQNAHRVLDSGTAIGKLIVEVD